MASEVSRAAKRNCALADEELHSNATLLTRDLFLSPFADADDP